NIIDLGGRHSPRIGIVRILAKCAVTAAVAAEIGNREKDFSRVCDRSAFVFVAQHARGADKGLEFRAAGMDQAICVRARNRHSRTVYNYFAWPERLPCMCSSARRRRSSTVSGGFWLTAKPMRQSTVRGRFLYTAS